MELSRVGGESARPTQGDRLPIWIGGQGQRALEVAAKHGCGLMLWFAEPGAVREYASRLRAAGGAGPVAAALRLAGKKDRWLELARAYAEVGTDLLILTGYGEGSTITQELEQFGAEVLPKIPEFTVVR